MSKKCKYCDSHDTELATSKWVGRGFLNVGRGVLATGAALGAFVISGGRNGYGGYAGQKVWEETDPGEFKGYHCRKCKRYF